MREGQLIAEKDLPRQQEILLEMLVEVDRICRQNGLKYCLYGGTMLGAIRHQGFIPWDDDADVTLLRQDYDKFRAACKTQLDTSRFYYQDHQNTPGYRWGYGKLRRKGTSFVRAGQEHMPYEQGVFLDIFPQDGVPDRFEPLYRCCCSAVRKLQWADAGRKSSKSAALRAWYGLLNAIPYSWVARRFENLVNIGKRNPSSEYTRVISWPRTKGRRKGMRREWFQQVADYPFEGHQLMGMADYHTFLSYIFGDYMRPPPPEKRTPGHKVSRYDLGKPAGGAKKQRPEKGA